MAKRATKTEGGSTKKVAKKSSGSGGSRSSGSRASESQGRSSQSDPVDALIKLLQSPNVVVLRRRSGSNTFDDYGNLTVEQAKTDGGVQRQTRGSAANPARLEVLTSAALFPWICPGNRRVSIRSARRASNQRLNSIQS